MARHVQKSIVMYTFVVTAMILIVGVLVWQGLTSAGVPDPSSKNLTPSAAIVDTGILVFREGLEAILVLSAITASLVRTQTVYWRPIAAGAGLSFMATLATWFVVVGILSAVNAPELDIQAATGLIAIIVLLVIMNWFFHKIYWTGWISHHNRKKRELIETTGNTRSTVYRGLVLLGFTSIYREGFEVVLFLQSIRLQVGFRVVLIGSAIGLALTLIVAALTFVSHHRLPYKKMLVLTGVMLGFVLIVMVGESVQEMQLAGWIPTTTVGVNMPGWMNLWFAVYPSAQSLICQALAVVAVLGSYVASSCMRIRGTRKKLSVS